MDAGKVNVVCLGEYWGVEGFYLIVLYGESWVTLVCFAYGEVGITERYMNGIRCQSSQYK
jgi:hypothetical protein